MAFIKTFIHLWVIITTLTITGCSSRNTTSSQEEIQRQIQLVVDEANIVTSGGEPFKAIEKLEQLLNKYPNNPKVLETIAFTYLDAKDPGLAAFYFEQVLINNPKGLEYRVFAAQAYTDAEEYDNAIRNYKLYLEHFPSEKGIWLALATNYEYNQNYVEAIEAFLKAHKLTDSEPTAEGCVKIAQLYQKSRDLDQMTYWLYKALEKEPRNQNALKALLKLEVSHQNYPLAEKHLKVLESMKLDPVDVHFISSSKEKIKEWREQLAQKEDLFAEDLNTEAIEVVSAEDELFKDEEKTTVQAVKPEEEKVQVAAVVKPNPPRTTNHFAYAQKAIARENYPEAIKHYWDAVTERPESARYWHELSLALTKSGDYKNAEMTMLEARRKDPRNVQYVLDYLKIFQEQGDYLRWLGELKQANKYFPNNPDILLSLGKAYEGIEHDSGLAKNTYQQLIKQFPRHPHCQYAQERLASIQ